MSNLLILGDKHYLKKEDYAMIKKQFRAIRILSITNDSEITLSRIKHFIKKENNSYIILNLNNKLVFETEEYLEELDFKGTVFFTFSEFSSKFLNQEKIKLNEKNHKILLDIQKNSANKLFKRLFDILFSVLAITFLFPIMLVIILWIKVKSPNGTIFFTQKRLGLNKKKFSVYKFRTMTPNAEKVLEEWLEKDEKIKKEYLIYRKLQNDPRIIKGVGEFLRKTSLDELPQFFNVLLGNMSIVGPRPYIYQEFEGYTQTHIDLISSIKPGITGFWQVTERNGTTFRSRVEKDIEYIAYQSFWMDIKIILKTVKVMIQKEGI